MVLPNIIAFHHPHARKRSGFFFALFGHHRSSRIISAEFFYFFDRISQAPTRQLQQDTVKGNLWHGQMADGNPHNAKHGND